MIVLFNLNSYLGGGEVILLRYAQFLKSCNEQFVILCLKGSYIENQSINKDLPYITWDVEEDTCFYMVESETKECIDSLKEKILNLNIKSARVLTYCLRDLYNTKLILNELPLDIESVTTAVYHPDDFLYLSSLSFKKSYIIRNNIYNFQRLDLKESVIFMNQFGAKRSTGNECNNVERIIPIPIELKNNSYINLKTKTDRLTVCCISRFVGFKMPSVIHFLNTARKLTQHNFVLIGHGTWLPLIKLYMSLFSIENVDIQERVPHEKLGDFIDSSDVGFAQGTSVLEFASRGVPVVVAPYSTLLDFLSLKKYMAYDYFGIKGEQLGDIHYKKLNCSKSLIDFIEMYPERVKDFQQDIVETLGIYEQTKVFNSITKVIKNSKFVPMDLKVPIKKGPYFKFLLKQFKKRF